MRGLNPEDIVPGVLLITTAILGAIFLFDFTTSGRELHSLNDRPELRIIGAVIEYHVNR